MTDVKADATPKTHRRRRASVGGFRLKLDAPQREGYVRRWVDDSPNRIAEMHDLGYDFAQEKAGKDEARTDGIGSRVTRIAGKRDNGSPHHLVLMETPVSEFEIGKAEKEFPGRIARTSFADFHEAGGGEFGFKTIAEGGGEVRHLPPVTNPTLKNPVQHLLGAIGRLSPSN
jgi:hypothetical protein